MFIEIIESLSELQYQQDFTAQWVNYIPSTYKDIICHLFI